MTDSELLKEAVEILKFYADDSANHIEKMKDRYSGYWMDNADDWSSPVDRFLRDEGSRAREFLKKLEETK